MTKASHVEGLLSLRRAAARSERSAHRGLGPRVRPEERRTFARAFACLFALLAAYYVLKPLRGVVLQTLVGVDRKGYALLLVTAVVALQAQLYGVAAARLSRRALVDGTYAAVLLSLFGLGAWLDKAPSVTAGFAFYAWVSAVGLLVISQFWSTATALWTHEQGVRLFGLLGAAAVLGSLVGNLMSVNLGRRLGPGGLLAIAAGWLGCAWLAGRSLAAASRRHRASGHTTLSPASVVLRSPYLLGIAAMSLLVNLVNTANEWALDKSLAGARLPVAEVQAFYARYMLDQNLLTLVLQVGVSARLVRRFGPGTALFAVPLVSVVGGITFALVPSLAVLRTLKVVENATDYSVHAASRELLYVPVSPLERDGAKAFNDTFVVRAGDAVAAATLLALARVAGPLASPRHLSLVVAGAAVAAVAAVFVIARVANLHRSLLRRANRRDLSEERAPAVESPTSA